MRGADFEAKRFSVMVGESQAYRDNFDKVFGKPDEIPAPAPRAPGYVASNGMLILPQRVREKLGVENGGGVMFMDCSEKSVEMCADAEFLRIVEAEPSVPVPAPYDAPALLSRALNMLTKLEWHGDDGERCELDRLLKDLRQAGIT